MLQAVTGNLPSHYESGILVGSVIPDVFPISGATA